MKKIITLLLVVSILGLTACGEEKLSNDNNIPNENKNQVETQKEEQKPVIVDDEIIDYEDDYNYNQEETIKVDKIINCDGCVFSYFSDEKEIGATLSSKEYTNDINNIKTSGGKQRHNFFGFVLDNNKISKAYSCILKNNNIYCIQGSVDGTYFTNNIGVLNQIFKTDECKYLSDGTNYWCTDGSYNGNTRKSGYTSMHYETSCTIYGSNSKPGKLACN